MSNLLQVLSMLAAPAVVLLTCRLLNRRADVSAAQQTHGPLVESSY